MKHYIMPELIRLKSKLEKKDYKLEAGIKTNWKDMKVYIQQEHARYKDSARHEVILPCVSLSLKCHKLSNNLYRIHELLTLTEKNINQRIQRYKSEPRTIFVSGPTSTHTETLATTEVPKEQTQAAEE